MKSCRNVMQNDFAVELIGEEYFWANTTPTSYSWPPVMSEEWAKRAYVVPGLVPQVLTEVAAMLRAMQDEAIQIRDSGGLEYNMFFPWIAEPLARLMACELHPNFAVEMRWSKLYWELKRLIDLAGPRSITGVPLVNVIGKKV